MIDLEKFINFDEKFWVGFSVILLIVFIYKPLKNITISSLDKQIDKVSKSLKEAKEISKEAKSLLKEFKHKHSLMHEEIARIVQESDEQIKTFIEKTEKEIAKAIEQRTDAAMQRIHQYEAMILDEVRKNAVDIAIYAVKSILKDKLSEEESEKMILNIANNINNTIN